MFLRHRSLLGTSELNVVIKLLSFKRWPILAANNVGLHRLRPRNVTDSLIVSQHCLLGFLEGLASVDFLFLVEDRLRTQECQYGNLLLIHQLYYSFLVLLPTNAFSLLIMSFLQTRSDTSP